MQRLRILSTFSITQDTENAIEKLQKAEKNDWIEELSWLNKTDTTFEVSFGERKVKSRLYDIDIIGYENDKGYETSEAHEEHYVKLRKTMGTH